MLPSQQYSYIKISSNKQLTPRAAKRHETQKIMDTVKTAMAFILTHCPAIQLRLQRKAKNNRTFWTKNRGKKRTGNWEVAGGRLGSLVRNNAAGWGRPRERPLRTSGISSSQVPPISSAYQPQPHTGILTLS